MIARVAGNVPRAFRLATLPATQRRQYTGTVLERESERAELASGLLAKVGGQRLLGASFEVRPLPTPRLWYYASQVAHVSAACRRSFCVDLPLRLSGAMRQPVCAVNGRLCASV